jgi:TrmH family RNA methyltransferase
VPAGNEGDSRGVEQRAPLAPRNPRLVALRRLLSDRRARRAAGRYVIEGPRLLAEALDAGAALDEVFWDVGARERHPDLLDRLGGEGHTPVWVAAGGLDRVGDAHRGQGVTAVAVAPPLADGTPPQRVVATGAAAGAAPLVLVLVDVADPGNVGTVLRAADAAAVDAVLLAGACADPLSPKVVRAAAGALFRVRVVETGDPLALLRAWRLGSVGLVVRGAEPLAAADLSAPLALVVGGEARGLSLELLGGLDDRRSIPMPGRAESLNVAMAATVALFEAVRQRTLPAGAAAGPGAPIDLAGPGAVGQGTRS